MKTRKFLLSIHKGKKMIKIEIGLILFVSFIMAIIICKMILSILIINKEVKTNILEYFNSSPSSSYSSPAISNLDQIQSNNILNITPSQSITGIVYTTSELNNKKWIEENNKTWSLKLVPYTSWADFQDILVRNSINKITKVYPAMYICDPYDYKLYFSNYEIITNSPTGYFIIITYNQKESRIKCPQDIVNKTIGYFDRSDYYFIKAIINGYRIDPSSVTLRQLEPNDLDDLKSVLYDIDFIITFIIPNSNIFEMIKLQDISIIGFNGLDINRIKLFYPYIIDYNKYNLTSLFTTNTSGIKLHISEDNLISYLPSLQLQLVLLQQTNTQNEGFISRLYLTPESLDPVYKCYGDITIESKPLCDSMFDIQGNPKEIQTVWDKQCTTDDECPFYKANTKYPNTRGGCIKGYCELPIGIKRMSYRKYNDVDLNAAFCYGCDPYDTACCGDNNTDFAFSDDTKDRLANGLETIITMK